MVMKHIVDHAKMHNDTISWRGTETSRIEAFSDSVFAFAITLLVVSLEVPKNFDDLLDNLSGFFAFGICFILLFQVWYYQNLFFRRYGLQDLKTLILNAALIFTVLFFVYPLKFLFSFIGPRTVGKFVIEQNEVPLLMLLYGAGFCAIFTIFSLLYHHAAKKSVELNLTPAELFETRTHLYRFISYVGVGVFAVMMAFIVPVDWAGVTGALYGLVGATVSIITGKRAKIKRRIYA